MWDWKLLLHKNCGSVQIVSLKISRPQFSTLVHTKGQFSRVQFRPCTAIFSAFVDFLSATSELPEIDVKNGTKSFKKVIKVISLLQRPHLETLKFHFSLGWERSVSYALIAKMTLFWNTRAFKDSHMKPYLKKIMYSDKILSV